MPRMSHAPLYGYVLNLGNSQDQSNLVFLRGFTCSRLCKLINCECCVHADRPTGRYADTTPIAVTAPPHRGESRRTQIGAAPDANACPGAISQPVLSKRVLAQI